MPVYEYRCTDCGEITDLVVALEKLEKSIVCGHCGASAQRILSRPSVHRSKASKLDRLDPKYDKMVDRAMSSTQNAEPDRILKKMKPFPGDG